MNFYKVLSADGLSIHGGDLKWSLPIKCNRHWRPGKWHGVAGSLRLCKHGMHLTRNPYQEWYRWGTVVYLAEGRGDFVGDRYKCAYREARLLRPVLPQWLHAAQRFVSSIPSVHWFSGAGPLDPQWRVFPTRNAALDAARGVPRNAAWNNSWNVARDITRRVPRHAVWNAVWDAALHEPRCTFMDAGLDAALLSVCYVVLPKSSPYFQHAAARWEVWRRGYGLYADVNDVFYVYRRGY